MDPAPLYPLRLDPIYQYRIWGGRRLADWASAPLPATGPIGEAWLLSDRDEQASVVSEGAFKGWTIARLIEELPERLLGSLAGRFRRFPLLLKFLDARENLSVQVHPSDEMSEYIPEGETGKTEAWVVLETGAKSRIYAGLTSDSTKAILEKRLENGDVIESVASFVPETGDSILIPARGSPLAERCRGFRGPRKQ